MHFPVDNFLTKVCIMRFVRLQKYDLSEIRKVIWRCQYHEKVYQAKRKKRYGIKKTKTNNFQNLFKTELVQYQYTVRNNLFFFYNKDIQINSYLEIKGEIFFYKYFILL